MKRIIRLFLAAAVLSLCACSLNPPRLTVIGKPEPDNSDPINIVIMTPAPTAEPTAVPPTREPEPTEEPTPEPTPTPEATPDPNRRMLALTFDDGPSESYTMMVLDILEQYGARATFFVQGNHLKDKGEILNRMVSLDCEIGCHGWNHTRMTTQSRDDMQKDFTRAIERISSEIEGGYTVTLMRPPYGDTNNSVFSAMKGIDLAIIKWNVDSRDWESRNADKIFEVCTSGLKSGQILIFHDKTQSTVDAIARLVPYFIENGYDLVTVTELIESSGSPVEAGKCYRFRPED